MVAPPCAARLDNGVGHGASRVERDTPDALPSQAYEKAPPMMIGFPLLLIPLAIVNILVFLMPGVSFTDPIFTVPLLSQAAWKITFGDMLIAFSMLLLLVEVIKG
ncbi:hypothetical protein, partial [Acinetobacter baumannii]|uniref:hypothetical protein n=1 Tax=Acinetobacter baumannii TaxID=470 RepID=UPI001BC87D82